MAEAFSDLPQELPPPTVVEAPQELSFVAVTADELPLAPGKEVDPTAQPEPFEMPPDDYPLPDLTVGSILEWSKLAYAITLEKIPPFGYDRVRQLFQDNPDAVQPVHYSLLVAEAVAAGKFEELRQEVPELDRYTNEAIDQLWSDEFALAHQMAMAEVAALPLYTGPAPPNSFTPRSIKSIVGAESTDIPEGTIVDGEYID